MKEYLIEWETDFCEDFPEKTGVCAIKANSEEEAAEAFRALKITKAIIMNITERN